MADIIQIRHDDQPDTSERKLGAEPVLAAVKAAAPVLADMTEVDRSFFLPRKAEELGVTEKVLKAAVRAIQNERSQQMLAKRLEEERAAEEKRKALAEEQRKLDLAAKAEKAAQREADQAKIRAEKEAATAAAKAAKLEAERVKKEAAAAEKEVERKAKEKQKGFAAIMKLPVDRHLRELTKLATTVDEDIATLRKEFEEFIGLEVGDAVENHRTLA